MNANDWLSNYSRVPRPENQYYYPGFNLGGPVKLPFTHFNKNREKLSVVSRKVWKIPTRSPGRLRALHASLRRSLSPTGHTSSKPSRR